MPSFDDLKKVMDGEAMGSAYIPFTFPTVTVRNNMMIWKVKASNADVDRLWEIYYQLTTSDPRLPAYSKAQAGVRTPLFTAMVQKSGMPELTVAAYLQAVEKAVNEQGQGWRWLDPALSDDATQGALSTGSNVVKQVGEAAGNLLKPSLDPITNVMKYTALAVAAGAVIYGLWNLAPVFKSMKRRKRKKGG